MSSRSRFRLYGAAVILLLALSPIPGIDLFYRSVLAILFGIVAAELILPPTYVVLGSSALTPLDVLPRVALSNVFAKTCHLLEIGRWRRMWIVNLRGRSEDRWGNQLLGAVAPALLVVVDVRDVTAIEPMSDERFVEFDLLLRTSARNTVLAGESTAEGVRRVTDAYPPLAWITKIGRIGADLRQLVDSAERATLEKLQRSRRGWPL